MVTFVRIARRLRHDLGQTPGYRDSDATGHLVGGDSDVWFGNVESNSQVLQRRTFRTGRVSER